MKQASLALGFLFLVQTFACIVYALIHPEQASVGYAVVPAFWCVLCFGFYYWKSKKR